jgi:predicted acylesterase/phospholipase RssA
MGAQPFHQVLAEELEDVKRRRAKPAAEPDEATNEATSSESRMEEREKERDAQSQALGIDLTGLALSGGGIRSATFALGVLQAIASLRLLRRFDYLSTVSGGGYIGS